MRRATVPFLAIMVYMMAAQSVQAELVTNVLSRSLAWDSEYAEQSWIIPPTGDPGNPEDPNIAPGLLAKDGTRWRTDRFTNISTRFNVEIHGIEIFACNPEDVGVSDIYGTAADGNWPEVRAAAADTFPAYAFWGGNWWIDLDVPSVPWDAPSIIGPPFPVLLAPGESFDMDSWYHHHEEFWEFFEDPDFYTGELVVGFSVDATISEVPEPTVLANMVVVAALVPLVVVVRRRKAKR